MGVQEKNRNYSEVVSNENIRSATKILNTMKVLKKSAAVPAISTASLPDIVFILLFFFMTVTVFQDKNLLVENELPSIDVVESLVNKEGVIELFIGRPVSKFEENFGGNSKIQADGRFIHTDQIAEYVLSELSKMPEKVQKKAIINLKVDKKVGMGLVYNVKEELKKVNMLKVNYATLESATVSVN